MKIIMKVSLITALAAGFSGGIALADDQQMQNLLALQRSQMQSNQSSQNSTTIGVYANRQGVSHQDTKRMQHERRESRFELQSAGQGQVSGRWEPAR